MDMAHSRWVRGGYSVRGILSSLPGLPIGCERTQNGEIRYCCRCELPRAATAHGRRILYAESLRRARVEPPRFPAAPAGHIGSILSRRAPSVGSTRQQCALSAISHTCQAHALDAVRVAADRVAYGPNRYRPRCISLASCKPARETGRHCIRSFRITQARDAHPGQHADAYGLVTARSLTCRRPDSHLAEL